MSVTASDLWKLIGEIETDLRRANAKFTTLRAHLAALPIPKERSDVKCRYCGVLLAGERTLRAHLAVVHDDSKAVLELQAETAALVAAETSET